MLRKLLDRLHRPFAKGGKLHWLYPLYEVTDTFLYTPGNVSSGAPHVRDGIDLKRLMSVVVIALLPCFFMAMHNTGYQVNQAIADAAGDCRRRRIGKGPASRFLAKRCLGHPRLRPRPGPFCDNFVLGASTFCRSIWYAHRGRVMGGSLQHCPQHEINEGFFVTSALFPLTLPATIPLWQVALGISFGVVIGKEIFGGTGKNFMNPALVGRAFLYFAYASSISGSTVWTAVDGFSGATPLGALVRRIGGPDRPR